MPADPRERAGRLAALLYLLGALDIAIRSVFLTEASDEVSLLLFAVAVAMVGIAHLHLPWRRWPGWALLVPFLVMLSAFSVVAGAACGELDAFLPLYGVAFIFIGLTQPVGTATLFAIPSIATSVAVTFGSQPRDTLIDIILAVILGTVIGELLAVFRTRQERSADGVRQLLDASNELVGCADVPSLFRVTSWWTRQILDADGVLLLQPSEIHRVPVHLPHGRAQDSGPFDPRRSREASSSTSCPGPAAPRSPCARGARSSSGTAGATPGSPTRSCARSVVRASCSFP